jgi:hypothetical protein
MELTAFAAGRLAAFARAGLRKHARAVEESRRCADRGWSAFRPVLQRSSKKFLCDLLHIAHEAAALLCGRLTDGPSTLCEDIHVEFVSSCLLFENATPMFVASLMSRLRTSVNFSIRGLSGIAAKCYLEAGAEANSAKILAGTAHGYHFRDPFVGSFFRSADLCMNILISYRIDYLEQA